MSLLTKYRNKFSLPIGHALIGHRADDQYLASFPRSGSTWLRTMLVNIMVPDANSNPDIFNAVIPGVSITNIPAIRGLQSPRIIHTHTYYRPDIKRVVYTVRDGRDVLISFYHYLITRRGLSIPFDRWFDLYISGVYGHMWDVNVISWMDIGKKLLGDNMMVVKFETMKSEPVETLIKICSHLDIATNSESIQHAVNLASIENARKIERERTETSNAIGNASFYRGGKAGQWEEYFTTDIEKKFWRYSESAMNAAGY